MSTRAAPTRTGTRRIRRPTTVIALVSVGALLALTVSAPRLASALPGGFENSLAAPAGMVLVLTWKNTSPLGFAASPCFYAGANSVLCNVTYWVDKDPNGTCALNGTSRWVSNVATSVSTKFYFAGASPMLPSAITYCGGGSTAKSIHFWFHVIPTSGTVTGAATVVGK